MPKKYLLIPLLFTILSQTAYSKDKKENDFPPWEVSTRTSFFGSSSAIDLYFGRSFLKKFTLGAGMGYDSWLYPGYKSFAYGLSLKYHFNFKRSSDKTRNWYLVSYYNIIHKEYHTNPQANYRLSSLNFSFGKNFSITSTLKVYSSLGYSWVNIFERTENPNYDSNNLTSERNMGTYSHKEIEIRLGIIKYF